MSVPELDEAELKVMTKAMFERGGVINVLNALITMDRCKVIITKKLIELIDEVN